MSAVGCKEGCIELLFISMVGHHMKFVWKPVLDVIDIICFH